MKTKIIKKLFLLIISLFVVIKFIFAATVFISGSVTPGLTISIAAEPIAQSLDLTTSTSIKIATVTEISNIKLFKVSILSTQGGYLVGNSSGATQAYTVSYDAGTAITLTSEYQDVFLATSKTHPAGDDKDLVISYTIVPDFLPADTYEDTIVVRIEAQ